MSDPLRLGTRGSLLALAQSQAVGEAISTASGRAVETVVVRTRGDEVQDRPLAEIGGVGLFTRALDEALLVGEVDLAVHSLKDLPTVVRDGTVLAAVPEREDPRDVLVGGRGPAVPLAELPAAARVGTGSLRRRALLKAHRADLRVDDIRGNLDTRIRKVDDGEYDAIVLAAAGIRRLGWTERIHEHLEPSSWLPAPGQGALALVARADDVDLVRSLRPVDHPPSHSAVTAERAVMHALEAGCQLPVGALGLPYGGGMRLRALVASPDGRRLVRAERTGAQDDPTTLGEQVARELLERGADAILSDVRRQLGSRGAGPSRGAAT